jgi:hypothetical protein
MHHNLVVANALGTFNDGTTRDVTSNVTWDFLEYFGGVSSSGLAQGVATGSATITASSGTVSASTNLQVNR